MTQHVTRPQRSATPRRRPPRWQLVVSLLLVVWLGAQFVAGWKFANGTTYPVVGSAMFNGPPIPGSDVFLVPRVFGTTADGSRVELDQHTFELEPFEWRRWIKRHLEDVGDATADGAAHDLAAAYQEATGRTLVQVELWRVPALTDDLGQARFVRAVEL